MLLKDEMKTNCAEQVTYAYSTRHNFWYTLMQIPFIPLLADPYAYPDADNPNADPDWK